MLDSVFWCQRKYPDDLPVMLARIDRLNSGLWDDYEVGTVSPNDGWPFAVI